MNHIKSVFKASDGTRIPYHSWEIRQGGYGRIAIVLGDSYTRIEENRRLVDFLLENYFKIYAPLIPEVNPEERASGGIDEFSLHFGSFRSFLEEKEKKLKMVPFVFSVSVLPFLSYYFRVLPPFKRMVFFSPVLDFREKPLNTSLLFKKRVGLSFEDDMLSEVEDERSAIRRILIENPTISKRLVRDMRREFDDFPGDYPLDVVSARIAVYYGEFDRLVNINRLELLKESLKNARMEMHGYPRMKHFLFYDKYWKRMLGDLKIFLTEQ